MGNTWNKIAQEGNVITLNRVLGIACLEASTKLQMQMLYDMLRKQMDYLQYGPKFKKGGKGSKKDTANSIQGKADGKASKCFRCGKGSDQPDQRCPATIWDILR